MLAQVALKGVGKREKKRAQGKEVWSEGEHSPSIFGLDHSIYTAWYVYVCPPALPYIVLCFLVSFVENFNRQSRIWPTLDVRQYLHCMTRTVYHD